MDQRNAGRAGAVSASDGWETYAADQLALLDHLDPAMSHHGRMHRLILLSGADQAAPDRVSAAVAAKSERTGSRRYRALYNMFDDWGGSSASGTPR